MTSNRFPNVIAACRKGVRSLWEIGDALIKDCGPPPKQPRSDGSYALIRDAVAALELEGLEDFDDRVLGNYREVAFDFPPERRYDGIHKRPQLGWSIHRVAMDPDTLDEFVVLAKELDRKPTYSFVQDVQQARRHSERVQRTTDKREAEREMARAAEEEAEARARKDKKAQAAAHAKKKQAKDKKKAASRRPTKVKGAPSAGETPALLLQIKLVGAASELRGAARKFDKVMTAEALELMRPSTATAVQNDLVAAMDILHSVSKRIATKLKEAGRPAAFLRAV